MGPWSREGWTVAYGPNLACCLFLYSLWAKNDALISQLFLQKEYFVIVKLHEIQVLASGIKFCWNTAPFNSSPSVLWLRLLWPQSWVVVTQTVWPVLPKIFTLWPFSEIVCCLLGCVAVVQLPSRVWLFAMPWTAACQAFLSFTISWSLPRLMFISSVMPSSCLILWCPLLLLPSIFPSIGDFSNKLSVCLLG